jgi:hypothetical protein
MQTPGPQGLNAVLSEKLSSSVAGQEMAVKARVVGLRPSSA